MAKSTDERGRLYLPKEVRERFGDEYRIVELPTHVALFPVDEDPLEGARAAVGEALQEDSVADLTKEARTAASADAAEDSRTE